MKKFSIILAALVMFVVAGCGGNSTGSTSSSAQPSAAPQPAKTEQPAKSEQPTQQPAAPEKVIEMNVGNFYGPTHYMSVSVLEPWKKVVEEQTQGRVKVNLFHGGQLGSPTSVLQDVKARSYDVGLMAPLYFADTEIFPLTIGNLPFALTNYKDSVSVMTKFEEKYKNEIWDGVVPMTIAGGPPAQLMSTKPVQSLGDLKNKSIAANTADDVELIKKWGAIPVNVTIPEMYESLQKHVIDVVFYSVPGAASSQLFEVAPYLSNVAIYTPNIIPIANKEFYDELPDDLRKLFDEELNQVLADNLANVAESELEIALKTIIEKTGNEQINLSADEVAKFSEAAELTWNNWVENANKRGYPGGQMMNDFKQMMKDAGITLPF